MLASKLLDEIRSGADVRPLLEKLKRPMFSAVAAGSMGGAGSEAGASTASLGRPSATRAEKMVTFEDDLKSSIATATNATTAQGHTY